MSSLESQISELVATASQLNAKAQSIIDMGISPEYVSSLVQTELQTQGSPTLTVVQETVDAAIVAQGDVATTVAATVEASINAAITAGEITGVTQEQADNAIANAISTDQVATPTTAASIADTQIQAAVTAGTLVTPAQIDTTLQAAISDGTLATPGQITTGIQASIDNGTLATPSYVGTSINNAFLNASSVGGVDISKIITVEDRLDLGVIN